MSGTTVIVEAEPGDAWLALGEHIARRAFGKLVIVTVWGHESDDVARRYATGPASARWAGVPSTPEPSDEPLPLMDAVGTVVRSFDGDRVLGPVGVGSTRRRALRACIDHLYGSDADLYVDRPAATDPVWADELSAAIDDLDPTILSIRARTVQARASAHMFPESRRPEEWRRAVDEGLELVLGDPHL